MRLSFGQTQIQTQKQVLAPRMIQSMEILQLPIQLLQERIEQEMAENPTLEIDDQRDEDTDETMAAELRAYLNWFDKYLDTADRFSR